MNQILFLQNNNSNYYKSSSFFNKNKKNIFKILLALLLIIISILIIYLIVYFYNLSSKENKSLQLENKIKISNLYNKDANYMAKTLSYTDETNNPYLIGIIEIDKINLHYPILSTSNSDSLKISPCRFARSNAK